MGWIGEGKEEVRGGEMDMVGAEALRELMMCGNEGAGWIV